MSRIVTMYKLIPMERGSTPDLMVECDGFARYSIEDTEHHDWLTQASFGKFDDHPSIKLNLDYWVGVYHGHNVKLIWRGIEHG